MTRADRGAQALGIPGGVLMERASVGMSRAILDSFGPLAGRRVLVAAGGGNNGGDGFVIARELYRAGADVAVFATKDEYGGDAAVNLDVLRNLAVRLVGRDAFSEELAGADLVVDALLGTGFEGEVRGDLSGLIREINDAAAPVVAVDVPSGVNGSTGEVEGPAVRADLTVCAHAAKVGCVVSPGGDHAGRVEVVDIGIPPEAEVEAATTWTDAASLRGVVPRRTGAAHKYSAGSLLIVAGSSSATGATVMVGRGAQRAGCGIVFVVTSESAAHRVDAALTEALVSGAPEDGDGLMSGDAVEHILGMSERASAIVLGPAAGVGEGGRRLVEGILNGTDLPILLDADAITNLPGPGALAARSGPTVITPHAGELGRLLGTGAKEVSARRLSSARRTAEESRSCVLLKGTDTLVAEGERVAVNSTGTHALATAGTGDVLSGVIGALLSRGADPYDAARTGAWAHGRAAELWLERTGRPVESMVATDLFEYLPEAFAELL
ncbi:NAD(P)H-hydrate dehydratase [Rubrobacter marinus]|uniref:Bifunctional NAD(P)H-hydrate repair enzyme n=1 Tax=Rubrobacter marinus TaxID=2653852 RepID=A0A6G8PZ48_9ACTN|nr:NAD(P)H-hydrate dehydratase [Rubrobacter marinus]QIN79491.1 NAD(P)H-hydrate dehydratase [Rubrobacter marinus]